MTDIFAQLGRVPLALLAVMLAGLAGLAGLLWLRERRDSRRADAAGDSPDASRAAGVILLAKWKARRRAGTWARHDRAMRRRGAWRRLRVPALAAISLAIGIGIAVRERWTTPPVWIPGADTGVGVGARVGAGVVQVLDGDTLNLGGQRIRLYGVDAPESEQSCERGGVAWRCGADAAAALRNFVAGRQVNCTAIGRDVYGRTIAQCAADGQDVGAWLVREGLAVAYREYSTTYVADEARARGERRGIWGGSFVLPSDHRRNSR
jgi:endonuclease YncB( thermonuclease family)